MPAGWSLLTNHGRVLVALARDPDLLEREIAASVGITERAVRAVIADLVAAGYVERFRVGRRNHYLVRGDRPLRQPLGSGRLVGDLMQALAPELHPAAVLGGPTALVLGCTDRRSQEPLRDLLSAEGLLGAAEIVLWPGGGAEVSGPESGRVIRLMQNAVGQNRPERVLLVSHEHCEARANRMRPDPTQGTRDLLARRRRAVTKLRRAFGTEPEVWYLTTRTAYRSKSSAAFGALRHEMAGTR